MSKTLFVLVVAAAGYFFFGSTPESHNHLPTITVEINRVALPTISNVMGGWENGSVYGGLMLDFGKSESLHGLIPSYYNIAPEPVLPPVHSWPVRAREARSIEVHPCPYNSEQDAVVLYVYDGNGARWRVDPQRWQTLGGVRATEDGKCLIGAQVYGMEESIPYGEIFVPEVRINGTWDQILPMVRTSQRFRQVAQVTSPILSFYNGASNSADDFIAFSYGQGIIQRDTGHLNLVISLDVDEASANPREGKNLELCLGDCRASWQLNGAEFPGDELDVVQSFLYAGQFQGTWGVPSGSHRVTVIPE